jgi:hypothetical protein
VAVCCVILCGSVVVKSSAEAPLSFCRSSGVYCTVVLLTRQCEGRSSRTLIGRHNSHNKAQAARCRLKTQNWRCPARSLSQGRPEVPHLARGFSFRKCTSMGTSSSLFLICVETIDQRCQSRVALAMVASFGDILKPHCTSRCFL